MGVLKENHECASTYPTPELIQMAFAEAAYRITFLLKCGIITQISID